MTFIMLTFIGGIFFLLPFISKSKKTGVVTCHAIASVFLTLSVIYGLSSISAYGTSSFSKGVSFMELMPFSIAIFPMLTITIAIIRKQILNKFEIEEEKKPARSIIGFIIGLLVLGLIFIMSIMAVGGF